LDGTDFSGDSIFGNWAAVVIVDEVPSGVVDVEAV
jgi:hypothetical protein